VFQSTALDDDDGAAVGDAVEGEFPSGEEVAKGQAETDASLVDAGAIVETKKTEV
jgi:hypothetical protein